MRATVDRLVHCTYLDCRLVVGNGSQSCRLCEVRPQVQPPWTAGDRRRRGPKSLRGGARARVKDGGLEDSVVETTGGDGMASECERGVGCRMRSGEWLQRERMARGGVSMG